MKILGHRGIILESEKPYQNSLEAFKLAISRTDGIETDACISHDGEIFLIHEAKYAKDKVEYALNDHLSTPTDKKLSELTAKEIKKLRLKDGSPIPTLEETLPLFTGTDKILNIEIKGKDVEKTLIPLLQKKLKQNIIKKEQLIVSSFNHPVLLKTRKAFPDLKIGMLYVLPEQTVTPLFPWTKNKLSRYIPLTERYLGSLLIKYIRPAYIIIPDSAATEQNIALIKEKVPYAKLIAWTFTENKTNNTHIKNTIKKHGKTGFLEAVIVDNPDIFKNL